MIKLRAKCQNGHRIWADGKGNRYRTFCKGNFTPSGKSIGDCPNESRERVKTSATVHYPDGIWK